MSLNKVDTLQRAYNKMDTCSPVGNWIEERSYNKFVGEGNQNRRVLVGNWQEESSPIASDTLSAANTINSTQRMSYNEASSDISSQARPPLGLRSQRRAAEITKLAIEATVKCQQASVDLITATPEEVFGSTYGDVFGRNQRQLRHEVPQEGKDLTYTSDSAITAYTGNPVTGTKMSVQGGTEETLGKPFARNSDFTRDIKTSLKGL